MEKVIAKNRLDKNDLEEIRQLEKACSNVEKLNMKLNWDMLESRSGALSDDFLYYDNGTLVGYLGMYGFGRDEIEITGMVHPECRKRGIFSELYKAAKVECIKRKIGKILLVTERAVSSYKGLVDSLGAAYEFSEYKLVRDCLPASFDTVHGVKLRKANSKDMHFLLEVDAASFGNNFDEVEEVLADERSWNSSYIGELEGVMLGKIRIVMENKNGGIYGFGILPEYRGRGYGREILLLAINELIKNNPDKIMLEVASANERALNLYKSCGFVEETVYDYYQIKLS